MRTYSMLFFLLLVVAQTVLLSCYSMDVHAVRSDELAVYKEDKILVFVDSVDLKLQSDLELSIANEFVKCGYDAVCFQDLFSPLKTYSPEEISEILKLSRIDIMLTVKVGQGSDYEGSVFLYGVAVPVYSNQLFISLELNEVETGQPILKATITGESEDLSMKSLFNKAAKRIVRTVFPEVKEVTSY